MPLALVPARSICAGDGVGHEYFGAVGQHWVLVLGLTIGNRSDIGNGTGY